MLASILRARVPEETTLDVFASAAPDDAAEAELVTTMIWRPSGQTCQTCGRTASRLWRTDGSLVCHECMSWDRG